MRRLRNINILCVMLFVLGAVPVGCVSEDPSEDSGISSSRSFEEELLAEDIEALLPGTWEWEKTSDADPPVKSQEISIVFLGHDAVTGDVAILIETPNHEIQPALVTLDEGVASLQLPPENSQLRIERIEDDVLVLQDEEGSKHLFHRRR